MNNLAPIALFVYNRPDHFRRTIEHLAANRLAGASELFIFSDGPRSGSDVSRIESVREIARSVSGFRRISVLARTQNLGLANSIITGVTEIIASHGSIIVLEDDMVTSPFFLQYMNDALQCYRNDDQVVSVHGYVYPVAADLPETFFLKGADCWGWATWKRGWDLFEPDGAVLLREMRRRGLAQEFDFNGSYPFTRMLKRQVAGKNDSWAIRWNASAFLKDKLTLYPGTSLIENIGLDSSGTHCSATDQFSVSISTRPITIERIPFTVDPFVLAAFERYFRSSTPSLAAAGIGKLRRLIGRDRGNT